MAIIHFKGQVTHTLGELPKLQHQAPNFNLTKTDLAEITLADFAGQNVVLNIFPSVDTPTCASSVRKFNAEASKLQNTTILCVSMDLPFAQQRFCGAEGLDKVIPASAFRHPEFGRDYGVSIIDGKLAGLLARSIVIIDTKGKVIYTEQVAELSHEPDYATALEYLTNQG